MKRFLLLLFTFGALQLSTSQKQHFSYLDVFDLQYASDPQISPNGEWVVYRRMGYDIMKDGSKGNLWLIRTDGSQHQKLTSNEVNESSPKWSPTGDR
ncbi:MAG: S9 family peptidase, partial [Allomuricauda sp.]